MTFDNSAMNFRLIDAGWDRVMDEAAHVDCANVRVICPFIKERTAGRLLHRRKAVPLQVITRFNLDEFCAGVNDISALGLLLNRGAQIRGVRNLHAKLYLFGPRAVVTSANLTEAALLRNHEFGFVAEYPDIVAQCNGYFEKLWAHAGSDLTASRLSDWQRQITAYLSTGARAPVPGLGDEGMDAGVTPDAVVLPAWVGSAEQAFVKFFGESDNRANRSMPVFEEVERSGSHWACTYPKDKRPRQVRDGAVMFMGRLVKDPNDILIYGRAVGLRHVDGRDNASAEDIRRRPWKQQWPHYVRVHHAEFVAGPLSNGVSLFGLLDALKANASAPTQRNVLKGAGNIDPRRAYMQQAALELSPQGCAWLNDRLQGAFRQHGKLPSADLERLDWPELPAP
jgi:hypothetical protein